MSVVAIYEAAAGERVYTKADIIRALVAQQWAVAIALEAAIADVLTTGNDLATVGARLTRAGVREATPCAADLAEEMLR